MTHILTLKHVNNKKNVLPCGRYVILLWHHAQRHSNKRGTKLLWSSRTWFDNSNFSAEIWLPLDHETGGQAKIGTEHEPYTALDLHTYDLRVLSIQCKKFLHTHTQNYRWINLRKIFNLAKISKYRCQITILSIFFLGG